MVSGLSDSSMLTSILQKYLANSSSNTSSSSGTAGATNGSSGTAGAGNTSSNGGTTGTTGTTAANSSGPSSADKASSSAIKNEVRTEEMAAFIGTMGPGRNYGLSTQDFLTNLLSMSNSGTSPVSGISTSGTGTLGTTQSVTQLLQASANYKANTMISLLHSAVSSTTSVTSSPTNLMHTLLSGQDPLAQAANVLGISVSTLVNGLAQSQSTASTSSQASSGSGTPLG